MYVCVFVFLTDFKTSVRAEAIVTKVILRGRSVFAVSLSLFEKALSLHGEVLNSNVPCRSRWPTLSRSPLVSVKHWSAGWRDSQNHKVLIGFCAPGRLFSCVSVWFVLVWRDCVEIHLTSYFGGGGWRHPAHPPQKKKNRDKYIGFCLENNWFLWFHDWHMKQFQHFGECAYSLLRFNKLDP